jgi:RNA polymerase sigma-70 factor (ECF subfamily)
MQGVVPEARGEPTAFEDMYRTYYRTVERFVAGHFGHLDVADVMSRTFETAWRRFDQIPIGATRGWLIGVARNCAMNSARQMRRRDAHVVAYTNSVTRWTDGLDRIDVPIETRTALIAAMGALAESDREVLLLATWHNLTGADLAAALGISTSAAGVRLFRARQRLRAAFETEGGEVA